MAQPAPSVAPVDSAGTSQSDREKWCAIIDSVHADPEVAVLLDSTESIKNAVSDRGAHTALTDAMYRTKFEDNDTFECALSILSIGCKDPKIRPSLLPSFATCVAMGARHFPRHLCVGMGKVRVRFNWPVALPICMTSRVAPSDPHGSFRIYGHFDVVIGFYHEFYLFLCEFAETKDSMSEPELAHAGKVKELYMHTMAHTWCTLKFFDSSSNDMEKLIATDAFKQCEQIRQKEEQFAPSGWDFCVFAAALVDIDKDKYGSDTDTAVSSAEDWIIKEMGDVMGTSNDHCVKRGNKVMQNGHMVYNRIVEAIFLL